MRARSLIIVVPTLLAFTGCGLLNRGNLKGRGACEHDFVDWWGDLSTYVDQGDADGSEWVFEVDPPEQWIVSAKGSYDESTGDFGFTRRYLARHTIAEYAAEGYGTVYEDGDLDVILAVNATDVLGVSGAWTERHERAGCVGSVTTTNEGADPVRMDYEVVSDNRIEGLIELDPGGGFYEQRLAFLSGGAQTRSTQYDLISELYEDNIEQEPNGTWEGEFFQTAVGAEAEGTIGGDISGATWAKYEQREDGEVVVIVDESRSYDGSGQQIVEYPQENLTCTFTFEANGANCEYECDKGQSGDC
jgi:hypothetical protein